MVDSGLPVTVSFPLHPGWEFLALVPDFNLPTTLARSVLPEQVSRADAIYNISHGAMVLKALELGDEKLLRTAMQELDCVSLLELTGETITGVTHTDKGSIHWTGVRRPD